ncbi:hypothetical protein [Agrobacterium tumefaciens]|uniref:hypothetical protein n=1 Tax=Agrobacterium tumefaciens TaxID=358 RepID=UPI0015746D02|nr:hypothetical protein [Agrobacterium tumefaciens]NTD85471.1 hypothetical protein [Agrobacterium tumefaciens]NTD90820.1 hypothetical protein [Agrobacterium tumefaciens]NTD96383.1 hypothetical protein [Agrobacterium tumefaciens]NTE15894.1 hypothetical protein [Agrobacterium tumefaciens]NTE23117.1 hypothetical protein [Agrobacterium tumefaciens]
MKVKFIFIPVIGAAVDHEVDVNVAPAKLWAALAVFVRPLFDEDVEHVAVLYKGQRRDMFVGETSSINGRHIRNIRATEIYRANTVSRMPPSFNPEELPAISGPAIIFPDTIVWT